MRIAAVISWVMLSMIPGAGGKAQERLAQSLSQQRAELELRRHRAFREQ